jgi:hypothetical protein
VGGSSDLAFASTAEEAARESCRVGAKDLFSQRIKSHQNNCLTDSNGGVSTGDGLSEKDLQSHPKGWLVQSFFAGYEPLRKAFGLENLPLEDEEEVEGNSVAVGELVRTVFKQEDLSTMINASSSSSSSESKNTDIDEGCPRSNGGTSSLPLPPPHLLDNSLSSGSNNVVGGDNSSVSGSSNSGVSGSVAPLDVKGFWLLRMLVGRLECTQEPNERELSAVLASEEKKREESDSENLGSWVGQAESMWAELCSEEEKENREGEVEEVDTEKNNGLSDVHMRADKLEGREEERSVEKKLDMDYKHMMEYLGLIGSSTPPDSEEDEEPDSTVGNRLGLKMGGRGSVQSLSSSSVKGSSGKKSTGTTSISAQPATSPIELESDAMLCSQGLYSVSNAPSSTDLPSTAEVESSPSISPPCAAFGWCLSLLILPEVRAITGVSFSHLGMVLEIDPLLRPSVEEERGMAEREAKRQENLSSSAKEKEKEKKWTVKEMDGEEEDEGNDEDWEDCDDDDDNEDEEEEEMEVVKNTPKSNSKATKEHLSAAREGSQGVALQEKTVASTSIDSDVTSVTLSTAALNITDRTIAQPTPPLSSQPRVLSRHLHARLLSICSSIAYLAGDAPGAVKCLRASVEEDDISG